MKMTWRAKAAGVGFAVAIGLIFGTGAGFLFQNVDVAVIVGGVLSGFSLDVLFNGSRCE